MSISIFNNLVPPDQNLIGAGCDNAETQSPLNRASRDKFILTFELPPILRRMASADKCLSVEQFRTSVYGVVVPPMTVPASEARYGGQSTHVSSMSRLPYSPLNIRFVVDNGYRNYYILWKWLAVLNDPRESQYSGAESHRITMMDNVFSGAGAEYQTTMFLTALNEYNEPVVEFRYLYSFITNLDGITYDYRDAELLELSAEFYFGQFEVRLF